MQTLSAGPAGVRESGSVHDCSPAEARALIAGGYAVAVDPASVVRETVTDAPAETSTDAGAAGRETTTAHPAAKSRRKK